MNRSYDTGGGPLLPHPLNLADQVATARPAIERKAPAELRQIVADSFAKDNLDGSK